MGFFEIVPHPAIPETALFPDFAAKRDYPLFTWDTGTGYNVEIYPAFTPGGLIYFIPRKYKRASSGFFADLMGLFADLGPVIPVALAVSGIFTGGLSSVLGDSILSALGITDAALSPVIGNIALSTAMNGGNVENAVKKAAISYASSGVGNFSGDALNSDLLGSVAGAATGAALSGKDITTAIFTVGIKGIDMDIFDSDEDYTFGYGVNTDYSGNVGGIDDTDYTYTDDFGNIAMTDIDTTDYTFGYGENTDYSGNVGGVDNTDYSFEEIPVYNFGETSSAPQTEVVAGPLVANPSIATDNEAGITFKEFMQYAPQVANLWNQIQGKPPIAATRTIGANGSQTTVNRNGTQTTRNPNGTVTTTRLPANQPYYFADGSYVIVDSNGGVTNVSNTGQISTGRVPANAGGAGGGSGLLLAAGAGLLLLMGNK